MGEDEALAEGRRKPRRKSPTQRSLALLRGEGCLAAVVEKWNPHVGIRQDLFGFGDVLALRPGETVIVQATTASNLAARVQKTLGLAEFHRAVGMGHVVVECHGWAKRGARGTVKHWQVTRRCFDGDGERPQRVQGETG